MKGLIFTYLMTYGGAIAALVDPFIGVLVYISFAVIRPDEMWRWSVPPGNYARIVAVASLAGWALRGFGRWDLGRGKTIIRILILYFGWIILSAVQAPNQALAWDFVEQYAKIILPILVGITTIKTVGQVRLLAWVILLSQAYCAFELNMTYFAGYNRLYFEGMGGVDANGYAISLVSCMGFACFLTWHSERWWQKAIAAVSAAFMAHAVLLSFSRGGMLSLIVMATVSFAVMPKGPKEYMAFALAVMVGLGLAGKEVRARFATSFADETGKREASAESRLQLWAACWDTMLENPLLGVGPDHMPLRMEQYGFRKGKEAHSLWLQTGAELGFPGMFLLLAYYVISIIRLWPIARGKTVVADPWLSYLARAVVGSLCGFIVAAQFVTVEFLEPPYYVAMVGVGILKFATFGRSGGQGRGITASVLTGQSVAVRHA
jgi:probable O-glycosylation ligase (exosortase A-associated)